MRTYLELAERIRGELLDLDRLVQRVLSAWEHSQISADTQDIYLDSVALNFHSFYSGIERQFVLIARHLDQQLPSGRMWHRDLLQLMARDNPTVRPAVIGSTIADGLDELRRFRHLVRNVYTFNLKPAKISPLIAKLPDLWQQLRAELLAFADFVSALSQHSEGA